MNEYADRLQPFVGTLKELAEGRLEPNDWLAYWEAHVQELEAACPRGWFLKLKPRGVADSGVNRAALESQQGACAILGALNVAFSRSDRYQLAWDEDFRRFEEAQKAKAKLRAKQLEPHLRALGVSFPKFARFLGRRAADVDELDGPASEQEIDEIERRLGVPLPISYRRFIACARTLSLDGFSMGLSQVFTHPASISTQSPPVPALCIAEYWLEADGDQVLVETHPQPAEDPPVYYYAHADGGKVRKLAASFSAWIESLPRSPVFRE
jgi:hypothetical protein